MTYEQFFGELRNKIIDTDVSSIHEHLAYQFNIEDTEAGGIFYVEIKEGQLHVEPYEYYDRHAIFISDPDTFMKIVEGKADPVHEYTEHRLGVEGDIDKALKLKHIIELKLNQDKKARKKK